MNAFGCDGIGFVAWFWSQICSIAEKLGSEVKLLDGKLLVPLFTLG